jgi:hypothetical protein
MNHSARPPIARSQPYGFPLFPLGDRDQPGDDQGGEVPAASWSGVRAPGDMSSQAR